MESTYSVWTYNNAEKWLKKSGGVPDMMLIPHLTHDNALKAAERLYERWPDAAFFVRNARDVTTYTVSPPGGNVPRETPQRPPRRRLGTREG
jgi:hypothetical protein